MNFDQQTIGMILCCTCGTKIAPNPSNMCLKCIMSRVDITEGIPKQVDAFFCRGCERYLCPPNHWVSAELESKELLTYCLKRIRGLNKVRLVDAGFVWTEPHSKRLKVRIKIQKEVFNGTIIQQDFVVEVVIQNHFCESCHRIEAKDTWNCVAQVRQHVDHKRTFLWIEQMIVKHRAQTHVLSIKEEADGLDFYFHSQNTCVKFINFLQTIVPLTFKQSKQLVGADLKSNEYNYKFTYSVEMPPICKEDLICLPLKLANQLGSISPLVLCFKITNVISFIDPFTGQVGEISDPNKYWAHNFRPIATRERLVEYIVLDIDIISRKGKFALAEATVVKAQTIDKSSNSYFTVTHLGHVLNVGDAVYGYDLEHSNFNDADLAPMKGRKVRSEVILVKKSYTGLRRNRPKRRNWKLAQLTIQSGDGTGGGEKRRGRNNTAREQEDREDFLRDLEEDPEMRSQINLYKADDAGAVSRDEEMFVDDEEFPDVKVSELIDMVEDLTLGTAVGDEDDV